MHRPRFARAGLFLLIAIAGCQSSTAPDESARASALADASKPETVEYPLIGVVKSVDAKARQVKIRHEEIPGFMPAMTMPFTVSDSKALEGVQPGDEVRAVLKVEKRGGEVEDYALEDLIVTNPAPPRPLSLRVGKGKAEVATLPESLRPGDMVPDFTMTDQSGRSLALSELRGNVVALTFIFTRCPLPDFCPKLDRKFADLSTKLAAVPHRADRVRLLSVSFDPEHDTPAVLASHARRMGAEPPLWTFAVASHPELSKVARPLGLVYGPARDDEVIHNLVIAIIDRDGKLARLETGDAARSWDLVDLLKSIYELLPDREK